MLRDLRELPRTVWPRALVYAAIAAAPIGVPSDLIVTPIFGRPVAVRSLDYVLLAATSALIGSILAIRPAISGEAGSDAAVERQGTTTLWGGFVSFLAVG